MLEGDRDLAGGAIYARPRVGLGRPQPPDAHHSGVAIQGTGGQTARVDVEGDLLDPPHHVIRRPREPTRKIKNAARRNEKRSATTDNTGSPKITRPVYTKNIEGPIHPPFLVRAAGQQRVRPEGVVLNDVVGPECL